MMEYLNNLKQDLVSIPHNLSSISQHDIEIIIIARNFPDIRTEDN